MTATMWPTHKTKARVRKNAKLYRKKRGIRLRRITKGGKRVVPHEHN